MAQVSVIIPVYNIERHLCQCLDSVAAQTLKDIEIICVDDGSTDSSLKILAHYAARDGRFRVLTQSNTGPGAARNAGLALANGQYVIFLDSDDWFEPNFLEQMLHRARETGADITICRAVEFETKTGRTLPSEWMLKEQYLPGDAFAPQEMAEHIFQFTYGMAWDKFYKLDFIKQTNIRFPCLYNSEDLAFVFPSLLSAKKIAICPLVLIHHRVNRTNSVSNTRENQPNAPYEAFQIVKGYLDWTGQMEMYQQSFLNWAMEFLVWHISNMGDPALQRVYLSVLREKWLPELKFEQYGRSYYESRSSYLKYLLAKYAPYRLFAGTVRGYKKGRRLLRRISFHI